MYILTNALKNLTRNKGRNFLLSAIILAIISTTVVALSITNTAENIIDRYRQSIGSRVHITPDMDAVMRDAPRIPGVPVEPPSMPPQQRLAFTRSQYIHSYNNVATQSAGNSELIAVDADAAVAEMPPIRMADGSDFPVAEQMTDVAAHHFRIIGCDRFDALHTSAYRHLWEGRMPQTDNEALISMELAELNNLDLGDVIRLYSNLTANGETREIYRDLTVVGTYFCMIPDPLEGLQVFRLTPMPSANPRNQILTTLNTVLADVDEYDSGFTVSSVFYLHNPSYLAAFEAEARSLGLDDIFLVSTNTERFYAAIAPIEGLRRVTQTFMFVVLILGGVVLMVISSVAIRERKYEIGVLRAMGMKKRKVAAGLWVEMLTLTAICLVVGLSVGSVVSQPLSDTLLAGQLENLADQNGGGAQTYVPAGGGIPRVILSPSVRYTPLDALDIALSMGTIIEIIGISLLLTSLAALAAIIKITKYEPIKILTERE